MPAKKLEATRVPLASVRRSAQSATAAVAAGRECVWKVTLAWSTLPKGAKTSVSVRLRRVRRRDISRSVDVSRGEFYGLRGEFYGLRGEFYGLRGEFYGLRGEFYGLRGEFFGLKGEFYGGDVVEVDGEGDQVPHVRGRHRRGDLRLLDAVVVVEEGRAVVEHHRLVRQVGAVCCLVVEGEHRRELALRRRARRPHPHAEGVRALPASVHGGAGGVGRVRLLHGVGAGAVALERAVPKLEGRDGHARARAGHRKAPGRGLRLAGERRRAARLCARHHRGRGHVRVRPHLHRRIRRER
eukprot:1194381-Prorocentrum_minimum.AAC.8